MISSIWKGTLVILASALLVGSLAGAAVAAPTGPTGAPTADPAAFRLTVAGTYRYHGRGYVLPKASLDVRGATKADLAGQRVALEIYRSGKRVAVKRVELQEAGGKSVFHTSWRATRKGSYRLRIALSDEQQQVAERGHSVRITAVRTNIHRGSRGVAVRVFQHKLRSLHYVAPLNGRFDAATGRGFMAFRKVTGLSRNYSAGSSVTRKLAAGRGAFRLRYPGAGRHVEVSIRRQVMVFASGGKVTRIYHVSTGKPSTPTVRGTYRVYMKDGGTNAKGMVKSSYFTGGYAIHGYKDVPPYAASHGCVRVPVPSASSIFGWVHMGTRIDTYY
jgi:hypothetical protein